MMCVCRAPVLNPAYLDERNRAEIHHCTPPPPPLPSLPGFYEPHYLFWTLRLGEERERETDYRPRFCCSRPR